MNSNIKKTVILTILLIASFFSNSTFSQTRPGDGIVCRVQQVKEELGQNKIKDNIVLGPLYNLRAQVLSKTAKGSQYIEDYNYVSKITAQSDTHIEISTLLNIVSVMPMIYEAYSNYIDTKYDGVIINRKLSDAINTILIDHKKISNDSKYLSIIDSLLMDLKSITDKNKKSVVSFMVK